MQVTSSRDNIRISPRKMRLIAPSVKGLPVEEALVKLRFTPKDAARPIIDVLKTAQADAVNNFKLEAGKLIVRQVDISEGPTFKRFRPRSRGMAHPVLKRTSHLKVTLEG